MRTIEARCEGVGYCKRGGYPVPYPSLDPFIYKGFGLR